MCGIQNNKNNGIKFANFLLLARAVYQNKKLYLIDDIFSAVDGHVAAHIYRKCILGEFYSILRWKLIISAAPLSGAQAELKLRLALTIPRKAPLRGAAEIISFHLRTLCARMK